MIRTYSELSSLKTFEERYEYLKLCGIVGEDTFGFDRYLNQIFYTGKLWRPLRSKIIVRDNGRDMGLEGYEIHGRIIVHHMNPITKQDILDNSEYLLNPEYLVCVGEMTHNAIHYGDANLLPKGPITRSPNDTCPWRH